jgi:hypothetical protein
VLAEVAFASARNKQAPGPLETLRLPNLTAALADKGSIPPGPPRSHFGLDAQYHINDGFSACIVSICITIIGWVWDVLGQAQVSTSLSSLFHFHFLPKHCHHHCCRPRHPYRRDHVIIGIAIKFIFPTTVISSSNYSCSCAVSFPVQH